MSDANRVALRYVKESTWGTTPTASASNDEVLRAIRFTKESFHNEPSSSVSQELRSDRQIADLILTDLKAAGGFDYEWSFASHDWALASLFQQPTYTSRDDNTVGSTTITASTGVIAGTGIGADMEVGEVIYLSGAANPNSNWGVYKLTAATANSITVTPLPIKDVSSAAVRVDRLSDVKTGLTITANSGTSKFTATGIDDYAAVGDWIRVYDPDSGNNSVHKVTAKATDELTVIPAPVSFTGDGDEVLMVGARMKNGTTLSSFTIERDYSDLSDAAQRYVRFVGATCESFSLRVATGQIIGGTFGFLAKNESSGTAALSNYATAESFGDGKSVMNAINHVSYVLVDGAAYPVTSLELNMNNNLRGRGQVGTLGSASIGSGTISVDGTIEAYYETKAQFDKFILQQEASLAFAFEDVDGNCYVFELPRIKYSAAERVGGGQNTDVIGKLTFQAIRDATNDYTVRLWRLDK